MCRKTNCFHQRTNIYEGILWSLGSSLTKMYLLNFINTKYSHWPQWDYLQCSVSKPELIILSGLLATDFIETICILLVIETDRIKNLSVCKTRDPQARLTKAGCWTQENVNWETTLWEQFQCKRDPSGQQIKPAFEAPWKLQLRPWVLPAEHKGWCKAWGFMYVVSSEPEPTPFSCKRLTLDTYWSQFKQSLF